MHEFCPLIKEKCRKDCVFRRVAPVASEKGVTNCQLAYTVELGEKVCDAIIIEKQDNLPPIN